ncbi:MAG: P-loop containing nucleoside triphosphate hydrolase protein, partial [Olpidium bornovanus]
MAPQAAEAASGTRARPPAHEALPPPATFWVPRAVALGASGARRRTSKRKAAPLPNSFVFHERRGREEEGPGQTAPPAHDGERHPADTGAAEARATAANGNAREVGGDERAVLGKPDNAAVCGDVQPAARSLKTPKLELRTPEGNCPEPPNVLPDEYSPIVERSEQQRWPGYGEPVCVVCGRYAEYINDATDRDVCSLECKAVDCGRTDDSATAIGAQAPSAPATDLPMLPTPPAPAPPQPLAPVARVFASLANYRPPVETASLGERQLRHLRENLRIVVEGSNPPAPIARLEGCNLPERLVSNARDAGIEQLTPVQRQAIPASLLGRDLFVCSPQGSGKTAAYLIPLLAHVAALSSFYATSTETGNPYAVILVPTRELGMQIEDGAKRLAEGLPRVRSALLVGGMPMPNQLHRLRKGAHYVVATPNRLLELLRIDALSCRHVQIVVVDEAEAMFGMGFERQVFGVLDALPRGRQVTLVSATYPATAKLSAVAAKMLSGALYVTVGQYCPDRPFPSPAAATTRPDRPPAVVSEKTAAASTASEPSSIDSLNVRHTLMWVENASKRKQLLSLLSDGKYYRPPVIVFVESRIGAELLAAWLAKRLEVPVESLHGDKTQEERSRALEKFRAGTCPVIVATEVLARGVHVDGVHLVVNFDMPGTIDAYVHQVGRAGRGDPLGANKRSEMAWAISFVNS